MLLSFDLLLPSVLIGAESLGSIMHAFCSTDVAISHGNLKWFTSIM